MKKDQLIYISKKTKIRGRQTKYYDINTEVFSFILKSHYPETELWHKYVIENLIERFREMIPYNDGIKLPIWLGEIDKIGSYNYITVIWHIYDQIIKDLGFAYLWHQKTLNEENVDKRVEYFKMVDHWTNKIKINNDQEFKNEKINKTFDKLIEVKKLKTINNYGTKTEYIPLEFEKEMIKDRLYEDLDKILSNIRETMLEVIALSKV